VVDRVVGLGVTFPAGSLITPVSVTLTPAPAAGAEPSVSVTVDCEALQLVWFTATGEPLISAVKSNALTVLHASGSLNVAVTDVLPGDADIEMKLGAVVSTVTVRLSVGDVLPPTSTARNASVCDPCESGEGLNVQLAARLPQPEQLTPAVENEPPSTWASTRAMEAVVDLAVPEYVGVASKVAVPSGGPLTVMAGVVRPGRTGVTGFGVGMGNTTIRICPAVARQLLCSRLSLTRRVSSAQASRK
jgi:hypothetical protein